MNRRSFLVSAAVLSVGCIRTTGVPGTVRIGYLPNLTHAPMLTAVGSGALQRALPGVKIELRTFRAGPRVCEALLGNAIDIGVTGPGPLVSMHARHSGNPLVIESGVASGGASLVVLPKITKPSDLAGSRVATPQIGSTPDVSIRSWLLKNNVATKDRGGDVIVDALAAANIMEEMRRGAITAAWLPEPWASRIVIELGAKRFLDERDLYPKHQFPTALLVARRPFHDARRAEIDAVIKVVHAEIARASTPESRTLAGSEIKRLTGKGLPPKVMDPAWARVDFTTDRLADELASIARDAEKLGYVPRADVSGLLV
jgi:NitT/TauT family transport system substrate-binding protein